jgi:mRNA interferase HigB
MHIIKRKPLLEFSERHPDAKKDIEAWWYEVRHANWNNPQDILKKFPSAVPIKNNRVVFHIVRNKYRLIVKFEYQKGQGYIRFIGTHAEYDRIDAENI